MARSRKGGRRSTPALAAWGAFMLVLGLGLGWVLSSQGCQRKTPERQEKEAPAPRKPGGQTPKEPVRKEPAAREATPAAKLATQTPESPPALPRLALVIDDFGYASPELVRRLCAQPVPFTAAVLPYLEFTKESATLAHEAGKEVILHLPMEPLGYPGPGKDPGVDAVMFNLPESEVRARVRKALLEVPYRRGVNNHMGSRITPDRQRMGWVLQEIKAAKGYFLDSRTEKDSVAFDVAKGLGIPCVERKVFLDDSKDFQEISKQWDRALALAKADGQVVVIGHIYPETVEALEKLVPRAKGQVVFVKASALVK